MGDVLSIDITRIGPFSCVRAAGALVHREQLRDLAAALDFVPEDDHLVVDLAELELLGHRCAAGLATHLRLRAAAAEVAVVSGRPDVTVQLVMRGIDHAVPVLHTLDQALDVLRSRTGLVTVGAGC